MSLTLLVLALLGVAGWFLLLTDPSQRRSRFCLVVEAVAAQTVVATLIAVALVSFGVFRPASTLALSAAVPLGALAGLARSRVRHALRGPLVSRHDLLSLLLLTLVAPIALPRMEQLRMDSDAGVYFNRAIYHLQKGVLEGRIPVRNRLEGDLLAVFDRDNMLAMASAERAGSYLPGTYVPVYDPSRFSFQFLPGWPMLMALWAGVFGIPRILYVLVFVYALSVLLFGLLLERHAKGDVARAITLALFASSPLLLFFSKYTTSEILLLFLFLFVLHFLGAESWVGAVLAGAGVLLLGVSHSSTFLYAPLLLLPVLEAYRSADRRLALFSVLAFGALLAGLPLGNFFSPSYLRDVFFQCFSLLHLRDPATVGLAVVAVFYAAGLALSLAILRRASGQPAQVSVRAAGAERFLPILVLPALALLAAWTARRGYQLGWTDRFARVSIPGAWSLRAVYVRQGWSSLAHLDFVSMVMATSLVGLPVVLVLAVSRGPEVCAARPRAFLLGAVLWTVAIYTFFRVDTPFNYYASRYFLPVLVPSAMLLLGSLLGQVRPGRATLALLALVGLGFNVYFDQVFYRYPAEGENLRFVQDVAGRVGRKRVLFVCADQPTHRLLALSLASLRDISVVRVAHLPGQPEMTLIERYSAQLGLSDAAVLSTFPPGDDRAFAVLELPERGFAQLEVVYPTEFVERQKRYYLYDLAFGTGDRDQVE